MAKETKRRSTRTKSSSKKAPAKRTRRSKKKGTFKKDLSIFGSVLLMIGMVVLGYQIGKSEAFEMPQPTPSPHQLAYKGESDNKALYDSLEKIKKERAQKEKEERERIARLKREIEQERLAQRKKAELEAKRAKELYKTPTVSYPTEIVKYEEVISLSQDKKPKLAIIIDDVSSKSQLRSLQSLGMKLTPSIFPPHMHSPHNHKLANGLSHYMIHLPMQSGKSYDTHEKTLMVSHTPEQIQKRVEEITMGGRRFTANKLYLEKEGFKVQIATNGAKESTDIALPHTVGMWEETAPVEITLAKGKNVLRFSHQTDGYAKGFSIRDFTLTISP